MMEKFDEFLEDIKKPEIEDEEFKKELKDKLFVLYEKRKALKKRKVLLRSLSYSFVILLIIIPTLFILNKLSVQSPSDENEYLVRNIKSQYEEKILKILENDMLLEEKIENDELVKIYKSGIKVYEKDGNFKKIISGEQNLEEHNINSKDLVDLINEENTKSLTINSNNIDKVLEIFKNDERFGFVNRDTIKNLINIDESLILVSVSENNNYWIFLIDSETNKIIYFEYPL
ncbi:MAG TPA: hypothetical protein PLH46_04175 [Caldisericia bacterium]|nr:hypothetical protein [Caldisericia bacterium]